MHSETVVEPVNVQSTPADFNSYGIIIDNMWDSDVATTVEGFYSPIKQLASPIVEGKTT